jgi:hypothetical protein
MSILKRISNFELAGKPALLISKGPSPSASMESSQEIKRKDSYGNSEDEDSAAVHSDVSSNENMVDEMVVDEEEDDEEER